MPVKITNSADTALQPCNEPIARASLWALVPVKGLAESKRRLNTTLGRDCHGIALAMLKDVLLALKNSREIEKIAVVTADAEVVAAVSGPGVVIVDEIGSRGMNAAIRLGIEQVQQMGGSHAVILPADIPLASAEELDRLMQLLAKEQLAGGNSVIGITPSANDNGTNLLYVETANNFPTRYGLNSCSLHIEKAWQCGHRPVTLESDTLSLDIDNRADLQAFIEHCVAEPRFQKTQTWKFLQASGLLDSLPNAARV